MAKKKKTKDTAGANGPDASNSSPSQSGAWAKMMSGVVAGPPAVGPLPDNAYAGGRRAQPVSKKLAAGGRRLDAGGAA
jgi:hypothetical protein